MTTTINASTSSGLVNTADTSGILQLQTASTAAVTVTASQNVGVGTASPSGKFHSASTALNGYTFNSGFTQIIAESNTTAGISIAAGSAATGGLVFANSNGGSDGYMIYDNASRYMAMATAGSERMRIDSSGNASIGTTSAGGARLQAQISKSNTATTDMTDNSTLSLANSGTGNGVFNCIKFAANQQDMFISTFNNNSQNSRRMGFFLGSVAGNAALDERLSILGSGNVGIGTSAPNYTLHVNGNTYVDTYLGIGVAPANTAVVKIDAPLNARDGIGLSTNQSPASGSFISFRNLSGNVAGSITHTGTTTVAYNTSSDYRLKENIVPMAGALAKVQALKPCTYTWKEDGTDGQGFIAHELQAVVPDCVSGEKDAMQTESYEISPAIEATYDEEGNELTAAVEAVMGEREVPKYQGIDTSYLVATLTAAIQEQQALITDLTTRLAALEGAK